MTKLDQIKILNNKIKANKVQYMLDRKNAEILAKSSGELDKYAYLTGKDLGYKPDSVEKAKFEYSPLGKAFTEGFKDEKCRDIKSAGLLKSLQNIHDVNKRQLEFLNNMANGDKDDRNDRNDGDDDDRGNGSNGGDDDDDDGDDDRDDKGNKNKNLQNPLYYSLSYDFRSYNRDFNKISSQESQEKFLREFKNKINVLKNLPFRDRGTKEQINKRKDRKKRTLNSASELYHKLYQHYMEQYVSQML